MGSRLNAMAFSTQQIINSQTGIASLDFIIDGSSVSEVDFDNATQTFVFIERLSAITIPSAELQLWVNTAFAFGDQLNKLFNLSGYNIGEFSVEFKQERTPDKLEMNASINGVSFSAEWTGSDIELSPRGELSMNFVEYSLFMQTHHSLLNYIKDF